jgi:hypothetical protein
MRRFSAFFSSAALVKLNDPVMTVDWSMIMILLWAIAWRASMKVGILELARSRFLYPSRKISVNLKAKLVHFLRHIRVFLFV